MITKTFAKHGKTCHVTFRVVLPPGVNAVSVVGDFNRWTPGEHPLLPRKDGAYSCSVPLPVGGRFEFKYLTTSGEWLNDDAADAHTSNDWGEVNSVVETAPPPSADKPAKKAAKKAAKKPANKAAKKAKKEKPGKEESAKRMKPAKKAGKKG